MKNLEAGKGLEEGTGEKGEETGETFKVVTQGSARNLHLYKYKYTNP